MSRQEWPFTWTPPAPSAGFTPYPVTAQGRERIKLAAVRVAAQRRTEARRAR